VKIDWSAQTPDDWDPLSTIFTMSIRIGEVEIPVRGVFDTGADFTDLQPPLIDQFHLDEDQYGFSPVIDDNGVVADTEPIAIATARLDGHDFPLPVHLYRTVRRSQHVFGRAGLLDYFRITLDPAAAATTFEWYGPSPKNRLDPIRKLWVTDRIGKRAAWMGQKVR
jgi:hypothetical protein